MPAPFEKLGKLSLAILENFVQSVLGEKFIDELRRPTDKALAIGTTLQNTEERFIKQFEDRTFAENIFNQQVSDANSQLLAGAIGKYYARPTNPDFPAALKRIITDCLPYQPEEQIDRAVDFYIKILTEELALVDDKFRESVRALADLQMVEILKRVEDLLRAGQIKQSISPMMFTIPPPVVDFTGRTDELNELKDAFSHGVLISCVTGGGGIGKTELARKLAQELAASFPDARMEIDLLGTSQMPLKPDEAMRRLLDPFYPGQKLPNDPNQLLGLYKQTFSSYKALLLLDNAADILQVKSLLPPAPSAAILTSRRRFSLNEFNVHPLSLDVLPLNQASALLRSATPQLKQASDQRVAQLAKICGCLPLALRVAAALLGNRQDWALSTLISRLSDERTRLQRLKHSEDRDVDATLSLSYKLLSPDLQKYFRYLGVFPAPFSRFAAAAVWGMDEEAADDVIGNLVNRSLLIFLPQNEDEACLYDLHDLTRLFANQRLLEVPLEAKQVIARHAEYYLELAGQSDTEYQKGGDHVLIGLNQFRSLWPHLSSASERFVPEHALYPGPDIADKWLIKFPGRCPHVLNLHVTPREQIPILERAINAARRLKDKKSESMHIGSLGNAYRELGNAHKAIEYHEQGLAIHREIGDRRGEGQALGDLGIAYCNLGDAHKAIEFYEKALAIAYEIHDRRAEAVILCNLGVAYAAMGNPHKAAEIHKKALKIARETGDRRCEGLALGNLGIDYRNLGDVRKAIVFYKQQLAIAHEIGDRRGEDAALGNLGNAYFSLHNARKAIEFYQQALVIDREIGDRRGEALDEWNLGLAYKELGKIEKAISHMQIYVDYEREIGHPDAEKDAKEIKKLKKKLH